MTLRLLALQLVLTASLDAAPLDEALDKPLTAGELLTRASTELDDGKAQEAAADATQCLVLDPKSARALEIRGHAYAMEKLWDRAERDFNAVNALAPDPSYRFQLAEIRFAQKDFTTARPRFVQLESEPRLADLAAYKVFLCDLFSGREQVALHDLGAMDAKPDSPSALYGHFTWCLFHNDRPTAEQLLSRANHLFDKTTEALYLSSLTETRRFHPFVATFRTKDGRQFDRVQVNLETDGLRTSTPTGWVTLPLAALPEDLSPFPPELRSQIERRRMEEAVAAESKPAAPESTLSFTTRSGQVYANVRWRMDDASLVILTEDGWRTISLDELPADISSFPAAAQQAIRTARTSAQDNATSQEVSFRTKAGKDYDHVRAWLTSDGLRILTPDGWTSVPADEIAPNQKSLPPAWQAALAANQAKRPDTSGPASVTFVTAKGKSYTSVRAVLSEEGLHLLTDNGWEMVPFDQLPMDLTAFPESWRTYIASRKVIALRADAKKPAHAP